MKCPNCGNENPPDYMFCDECGARLASDEAGAGAGAAEMAGMPEITSSDGHGMHAEETGDQHFAAAPTMEHEGGHIAQMDQMPMPEMEQADEAQSAMPAGSKQMSGGLDTGTDIDTPDLHISHASEATDIAAMDLPVTEDTVQTHSPESDQSESQHEGMHAQAEMDSRQEAVDNSQDAAIEEPMPGVVPIFSEHGSMQHAVVDESDHAGSQADSQMDNMVDDGQEAESSSPEMASSMQAEATPADTITDSTTSAAPPMQGTQGTDGGWANTALGHLDEAQRSMSGGDWLGFGQALATLRQFLQSISTGSPASHADSSAGMASSGIASSSSMTPSGMASSPAHDYSNTGQATSSVQPQGQSLQADPQQSGSSAEQEYYSPPASQVVEASPSLEPQYSQYARPQEAAPAPVQADRPTPEPASEAGSPAAMAGGQSMESTSAPSPMAAATPVPSGTGGTSGATTNQSVAPNARLVVISTGSEMSLPDHEEITVGREDPSSGIFPDVDLTPYGGEEGGVSRRHARLLHLGNDYFVEDLQSTNYTKLDGQRLPAHVRERLEDGARIDFGRVATIFRSS